MGIQTNRVKSVMTQDGNWNGGTRGRKSWCRFPGKRHDRWFDRGTDRHPNGPRSVGMGRKVGPRKRNEPLHDHSPQWSYFNSGDPADPLRVPPIVWIRTVRHGHSIASMGPRENASGDQGRSTGRVLRYRRHGQRTLDGRTRHGARRKRWRRNKRTRSRTTVVASRRKTFDCRYHRLSVELVLSATRDRSTDKWRTVNSTVYRPTHGPWKKKPPEILFFLMAGTPQQPLPLARRAATMR